MVGTKRAAEGGSATATISTRVQKTIQSIKEIVGDHSEADIYAALKESNMDPNETAQKLLNQDPFHEVKRRRDRKKENEGSRNVNDMLKPIENNMQFSRFYTSLDRNARRRGFQRNSGPDTKVSQQFRVVRDNRQNRSACWYAMVESSQNAAPSTTVAVSNVQPKSLTDTSSESKHTSFANVEGQIQSTFVSRASVSVPVKETQQARTPALDTEKRLASLASSSKPQRQAHINPEPSTTSVSTGSDVGVYSSSSDPVHVPTTGSRPSGAVGAIRREVGIVEGWEQQSIDASAAKESFRQSSGALKNNLVSSASEAESTLPNRSHSNYTSRQHQQSVNHQKAAQLSREWKPKSSQKRGMNNPTAEGTESGQAVTLADNFGGLQIGDVTILSEKLAEVNISTNLHVIIPRHLRVPESERAGLIFGSFGNQPGSFKVSEPLKTYENIVDSSDEPSGSVSASVLPGSDNQMSDDQGDHVDANGRVLPSDFSASGAEYEPPVPESSESPGRYTERHADVGTRHSHSSADDSPDMLQMNDSQNLPSFSAHDHQEDMAFYRIPIEDNIHDQDFPAQSEAMTPQLTASAPSTAATLQQQQEAMAQMYPQVHISHYPNFVPYRHIFSPVYMPPMAVPNYPNNPAYPHPSSGNNYVLMPGGSSHLSSGGMKYAASQYKPVPAGSPTTYGAYTNPAAFAVGPPGTAVGSATGLEDVSRIKYKDNNLYVPSPQTDASDIWVEAPRELPNLQSPSPFYNMSGQTSHATFVPAHAGHASVNAAAALASPVQYPSLYHPPQSGSITNPHHLVHQQVAPAIGGNVGVGVVAPGTQIGTYQQPQLSHLSWNSNF